MRSDFVTANTVAYPTDYNSLINDAAGSASLFAHNQLGFFTLSTNPTNTKTLTLTINGTAVVITFVTSIGASAGNLLIQATAALTAQALLNFLQNPTISNANQVAIGVNTSTNVTLINSLDYALSGTTLTISSLNSLLNTPLTSFTGATTATSDSYTAQTMQLYVEPGVFYIAGTRVIFAGGSTSTVTAPSSHPRIDVLSINSSGTLSWTTGTENASPTAPTYPNPASNLVICELYNVVSETQLLDYANQSASQGYVYNDVRTFQTPSLNWTAFTSNFIPDADGTRDLGSASFEWNHVYAKTLVANGLVFAGRFGGTGADGALTVTSGTTTISASSAAFLKKNYTSISITGTAYVQFTTPHANGTLIQVKSQGAVTLTSSATPMLDASAMGGAGGTGTQTSNNVPGSQPNSNFFSATTLAGSGGAEYLGSDGAGGAGGTNQPLIIHTDIIGKIIPLVCGGGGGAGGGQNNNTGGNGGNGGIGGGALYIECGGAFNFTTTSGISVAGIAGTAGTSGSPDSGGGGGGGGGGMLVILYGTLTANSGTVTVSGGTGGASGGSHGGGGGGGAASLTNSGSAGTGAGGAGGAGGNGTSLIEANVDFA